MIELAIIWALCAGFACWRAVQEYGHITLFEALMLTSVAPFSALISAIVWADDSGWKSPVIWRKK